MIFTFKTKPTINGNVYYLRIDTSKKVFTMNTLEFSGIVTTYKNIRELVKQAKSCGYVEH